jgi:hypothetical protein
MTDFNAELFTKLYSKLALSLGVTPKDDDKADTELHELLGQPPVPRYKSVAASNDSPQFLLAIFNPGQYIPSNLDPESKAGDRFDLSIMLDAVPQFSWVYKPAATTVSNAYQTILENHQAPLTTLTPDQQAKLDDADATVTKYEGVYEKYQDAYFDALDVYDEAYASWVNGGPAIPRSAKLKLQAALDKWDRDGHRSAVDAATAVIVKYEALDPEVFWSRLLKRYNDGTEVNPTGSNPFQPVGVTPPYRSWLTDAGWTSFSFTQKDMDNQKNSEAIGVSGNLDGNFGMFRISGDGSYDKDSSFTKMDQTELTFSSKLFRVSLSRTWMNPLVLSSRGWRFLAGTSGPLSTGGDIFNDVVPTGQMTVIPTAAILSKDLQIKGTFDKTVVESMNQKIAAKASVGFGPFTIAGQFNMENHSGSEKGTIATNTISAPDIQLMAFVCEVLPQCPNPDPALKWPQQ